jgi:hypothetical protein
MLHAAEEKERALKSDGYSKLFNNTGTRFLRTGHFNDNVPQHLRMQCQPPAAIVESLLGLESNSPENHEQAESESDGETEVGLPPVLQDIVQPTLNERMDSINNTVNDLRGQFSSRMKAQEKCRKVCPELERLGIGC